MILFALLWVLIEAAWIHLFYAVLPLWVFSASALGMKPLLRLVDAASPLLAYFALTLCLRLWVLLWVRRAFLKS
jgi:hypothetical protein